MKYKTFLCVVCYWTIAFGQTMEQLAKDLKHRDPEVRRNAADAFYQLVKTKPDQIATYTPALSEALRDTNRDVRLSAVTTLAELGTRVRPYAEQAVPILVLTLNDESPGVSAQASRVLRNIGRPAVVSLARALKSENTARLAPILDILGNIGDEATDAIPVLTELLKNTKANESFRQFYVARTLFSIDPDNDDAGTTLFALFADSKKGHQLGAALCLAKTKKYAHVPGAFLVQEAERATVLSTLCECLMALWEIGNKGGYKEPILRRLIESGMAKKAEVTGLVGAVAYKALPSDARAKALRDQGADEFLLMATSQLPEAWRLMGIELLGEIRASKAIPELNQIFNNSNESAKIRRAAENAIAAMEKKKK